MKNRPGQDAPAHHAAAAVSPRHPSRALLDGLPSVENGAWADPVHDKLQPQGGFGESQGRHAQSGQSRGGVDFGGRQHESQPSLGVRPLGHRGRGPRGYVRPDESIADDVIARLTDDHAIDASEILLSVEHGLVTLTGNVPRRAMKRRAEDVAAMASGVRDVDNHIRVDDGSASIGLPGQAVRSGHDQLGSGFSSSARPDPLYDNPSDDSNWPSA
ncbi:MAG: hypothetical protein JWL98_1669 [Xanthomonadaceae bacterium]|nr:hypothetical protein [Xanthomonadaceae bacterium]